MSGKKISKGKRFWKRTLKEFEGAGLSVGKFCALKGIGVSTFYQYRSKLNNRFNSRGKEQGGFTPLHIEEDFVEGGSLTSGAIIDDGRPSINNSPFEDEGIVPAVEGSKRFHTSLQEKPLKEGFDLHIGENLLLKIPFGFDPIELKRLVGVLC
jgi:hypothetical protein